MSVNPLLSEELLQYIWQSGLFNQQELSTVAGEPLTIISRGQLNRNAGPDFTAARIRIGAVEWAGNVELHYRTSDWRKHGHHRNPRYDNVILHVVFEHDVPSHDAPCLELHHRIPKLLLQRYQTLKESEAFIPCAPLLSRLQEQAWTPWKAALMEERLERKTGLLFNWLQQSRFNWEEVCFRAMAQGFGMPVNTEAFLQLALSLPFMLLARQRPHLLRLESLLFGQAGMLAGQFRDAYPRQLQQEYQFLQHKYRLEPMPAHGWNWLRMRPSSFPTMRIACFAALLHQTPHLFSRLLELEDPSAAEQLFHAAPSPYWEDHYRFDIPSVRTAGIGKSTILRIIVNVVIPLLYLYGKHMGLAVYRQRALHFLQQLPAENNRIIRGWSDLVPVASAWDSQALLQLKQYYCEEKRCLGCGIGMRLLEDDITS
ncbi:DUF2851 family protein [Chitinophaga cymbidii]|uniref:DUF2851 domain-containing protein n=1 Tax=Chitinophaga cymbidii TaxID=1096750 RepID=A0A512RDR8_9BACT|nr:DUF2851 family protein [Chitinophaga cymbidii]GEP93839.1 hypothetical protein CCY01nite_00990 [Chitinophaga cymbidii]